MRCSREVRLHLEGQGLAAGPHEVVRHGRLPRVRLESRDLLGDERPDGRRELEAVAGEAVAGPEARDVRLADDRVDVVLVDRVHAREADDLAGGLEAGEAVEEAVEVYFPTRPTAVRKSDMYYNVLITRGKEGRMERRE